MSLEMLLEVASYVPPFCLAVLAVVIVHEFGHYLLARMNGVRVEAFSVGFGPEIVGWTDAHGTRWRLSAFPLGGYIKMFGEQSELGGDESAPSATSSSEADYAKDSLLSKTALQKISILLAGPLFNYLFALLVIFSLYATVGQRFLSSEISDVVHDGPAQRAGIQAGDRILSIHGVPIESFQGIQKAMATLDPTVKTFDVALQRDDKQITVHVNADFREIKDRFGRLHHSMTLGVVKGNQWDYKAHSILSAATASVQEVYQLSVDMLKGIGQMVTGSRSSEELRGVLSIAKISGDAAQMGISAFIFWLALFSINLGIINLLPIPPFDGGHIMFYSFQKALGRPIAERIQNVVFQAGFVLVLGLMTLSFWNDLKHVGIVRWISSLLS